MFGHVRLLYPRVTALCQFHTSTVHQQYKTPVHNPGVYRRLKVISEDEPDIDKANIDYESIEGLEEDFMQAAEMGDEIISHMKSISKAQQYRITERKHFRPPKERGMLTWSEKEQIRFLHQSDPEKWSPEVLAESFPASPDIIKKILKVKWKPNTAEKLKAHDQRVSDNWKAFHRGQLEVHDQRLKEHLAKFTDRKDGVRLISDEEAAKITEVILPKPKRTEFLSLVTSFKSENVTNKTETKQLEDRSQIENQYPPSIIDRSKAHYTLDQFRKRLVDEIDNPLESPDEIRAIIRSRTTEMSGPDSSSAERYVAPSERFITDATVHQKRGKSALTLQDPDDLVHKITIPKDQFKPGLLYRVKDCFYNDKGYFLYRVPGLKV